MANIRTFTQLLLFAAALFFLSSCCTKEYKYLSPLRVCFDKPPYNFITTATIIISENNRRDTLQYTFSSSNACLSIETENLLHDGVIELITDTPFTKTTLTDFVRIEDKGKGCGGAPQYSFSVNGVSRDIREEHQLIIEL